MVARNSQMIQISLVSDCAVAARGDGGSPPVRDAASVANTLEAKEPMRV